MHFRDLNEAQILALAVTAEEEDAHIYRDFAQLRIRDFTYGHFEMFVRLRLGDGQTSNLANSANKRLRSGPAACDSSASYLLRACYCHWRAAAWACCWQSGETLCSYR